MYFLKLQFYADANADKDSSVPILDRFVELGGNFIDTSDCYNMGQSEELLAEWMKRYANKRFAK